MSKINSCGYCSCQHVDLITYFGNFDKQYLDSNKPIGYFFKCCSCNNIGEDSESIEEALKNWNKENE